MSPNSSFRLLLVVLTVCVAVAAAVSLLPPEQLAFFESIPAKRWLTGFLAINLAAAASIVYFYLVLPSPPRFASTMAFLGIGVISAMIAGTALRPDEFTFAFNHERGFPELKVKFGGLNGWSVLLGFGLLLFIFFIVRFYPEEYYRHYRKSSVTDK